MLPTPRQQIQTCGFRKLENLCFRVNSANLKTILFLAPDAQRSRKSSVFYVNLISSNCCYFILSKEKTSHVTFYVTNVESSDSLGVEKIGFLFVLV